MCIFHNAETNIKKNIVFHINYHKIISIIIFIILFNINMVPAEQSMEESNNNLLKNNDFSVNVSLVYPPKNMEIIKFYKKYISSLDGNRCSMYPSCSKYASTAFKKHGFLIGWIMTCDRLIRCGGDEVLTSKQISVNNKKIYIDPVNANDFWWFKKKDEK